MRKVMIITSVPIDNLTVEEAVQRIEEFVEIGRATGKHHQIATVNADFAVNAMLDPELRGILQEADMTTADGMPLVWVSKLLGYPLRGRVTGADLVPKLAEIATLKGYSLFLLGGAPGSATRASQVLKERHSDLKIAGILEPPYRTVLEMDQSIVDAIRDARPDILLVAFGNPKQEKWIAMHARELGIPVSIGIGCTLDLVAGITKRAPKWMQHAGLEWLFRVMQEPGRLWRRYALDLVGFGYFFFRQWIAMRGGQTVTAALPIKDTVIVRDKAIIKLRGRIDAFNISNVDAHIEEALSTSSCVVLNMAEVDFLDSSAIGSLVTLTKRAREADRSLVLTMVSPTILRVIGILRLDHFLDIRSEFLSILMQKDSAEKTLPQEESMVAGWSVVQMPKRFDSGSAPSTLLKCREQLAHNARLVLDFSETVFLASAGMATMLSLNNEAKNCGGELCITGCSQDVQKVISLVKLDRTFALFPIADLAAQNGFHKVRNATPAEEYTDEQMQKLVPSLPPSPHN